MQQLADQGLSNKKNKIFNVQVFLKNASIARSQAEPGNEQ